MKERKLGRIIILCAFFVIICCSKGIWFFSEKFIDSTNYENRKLASKPTIKHWTIIGRFLMSIQHILMIIFNSEIP